MSLLNVIFIIWVLSEVILNRFVRSGKSDKQTADKKSELYIWLSILISITIAVFISFKIPCIIFTNEGVMNLFFIGPVLIIAGIIIRFTAIKQLGRFFTVDVTIRKDHQLMQTGFYKYVRHPSYTGSLLSFLGFGICLNNWISLAVVFFAVLSSFINRMNVEEKVLVEQFGEQYLNYVKKTKRLIPFLY